MNLKLESQNSMDGFERKQKELWLSFLRYGLVPPQFPREMLHTRLRVKSEREYLDVLKQRWRTDCFTSVYTDWQREEKILDTIFLENDYENLEDANKDHEKLMSFFKIHGIWTRTNFSGRRSYHYYIDIPPTRLENPGDAIRSWVDSLPVKFDPVIEGNISCMARIPGTLHSSTGLFCIPINSPVDIGSTIDLNNARIQETIPNIGIANLLKGFKLRDDKSEPYNKMKILSGGTTGAKIPPCIVSIINFAANTGQCGHAWRIHLGSYLLKAYGEEMATNLFKDICSDFSQGTTSYHLKWLAKRNWNCYKCSRAKEIGICPLAENEVCSFYPSLNWHI